MAGTVSGLNGDHRVGVEGRMSIQTARGDQTRRNLGRLDPWTWLWREWVRPLGATALVVFGLRSAVADWNHVPTGSMQPTILEGDRVLVNRLAYDLKVPFTTWHLAEWGGPATGDIVVFYSPENGQRLVKRVVGKPGDQVELRSNRLLINGMPVEYGPVEERYLQAIPDAERDRRELAMERLEGREHAVMGMPDRPAWRDFGPVLVPKGEYFMMGDSRDNSRDSRYFGSVPRRSVLGRATSVVASVDPSASYRPRWGRWFTRLE